MLSSMTTCRRPKQCPLHRRLTCLLSRRQLQSRETSVPLTILKCRHEHVNTAGCAKCSAAIKPHGAYHQVLSRAFKQSARTSQLRGKRRRQSLRSNQGNDVGEGGGHPQTRNQFRHETSRCPERLLVSSKFLKPLLHPPHPPSPRTRVVGSSRLSGSRLSWAQHRQKPSSGKAAAKMLVRAGLRCRCHFALHCPDLLDDRRGTKHLHSPSAMYSPGLAEGELICVEFSLRVCSLICAA